MKKEKFKLFYSSESKIKLTVDLQKFHSRFAYLGVFIPNSTYDRNATEHEIMIYLQYTSQILLL